MVNAKAKGNRNERKAKKKLEEEGYRVCKVINTKFGDTDFFNLFDLIAIKKNSPIRLVQVKSNRARGIQQFCKDVEQFVPKEHCIVEFWVYYDYKGVRILRLNFNGGYTTFLDER